MTAALILQYVMAALQALPSVISAGATVESWVTSMTAELQAMQASNSDPTPAQWAALNAQLLAAVQALQAAKPAPDTPVAEPSSPA